MGSIRKRRYKAGFRYMLDFYDQQGKRQRPVLPEGTTKKRAREILRDLESQVSRGVYTPEKRIPTFEQAAKDWLKHKKPNLRFPTYSAYEGHTRNHFSEFESLKINRITTAMVEQYISDRRERGMNILTLRKVLVTLGQIFSYAVRHGYMHHNPLRDAERPKAQGEEAKRKIRILTTDEINSLLKATSDKKYRTLFKLAIMSGARQGELLGLKWKDVDWDNNQIQIRRTFNNQQWFKPKTKTSERRIDLGPQMMKNLKKWKMACPPNKLNLIFPNEAGQPLNHNNMVNRFFAPALESAEIGVVRFHDLRHTYASLLIEQGENVKYIQTQLGHSNPTVTLNVYAHLMKPVNQESACRLESTVFQVDGHEMGTKAN